MLKALQSKKKKPVKKAAAKSTRIIRKSPVKKKAKK
jgi:hypothetical protein